MINKNKHLSKVLLILIFLTGIFFRFYQLGKSPSGFYVDEASLGYNAYSILKTGKDEFGKFLPIMFRSFVTFQSPVYTYLIVPIIPIFGLSPFTTRFPSAFFGVLLLPALYLLVKSLAPKKYAHSLALISTLFLAISPWHILYSRTAYEANVALFFLIFGSLMFQYSLKKPWLLVISSVAFGISFVAYRAETLVTPLLVIILTIKSFPLISDKLRKYFLPAIFSLIFGLLICLPTISIMKTPGFQARTAVLNIFSFSSQKPWGYQDQKTNSHILNMPQLLSLREFASLYSSYFSPRYMFSLGDQGPRKPYPDLATFFVWQFPLYLSGLYYLLKQEKASFFKTFVLGLLLISPVPAAMTRDPYSTLRSLTMVIPLIIIISFGLVKLLEKVRNFHPKFQDLILVFLIVFSTTKMFISIFYLHDYFRSQYWDYGWESLVKDEIKKLDPNIPILVDDTRGHPYILLLFFLKFDPATYQSTNHEVFSNEYYTSMIRNTNKHIGQINVRQVVWGPDTDHVEQYIITDNLTISDQQIKDHNLTKIKEIKYPNGDVALKIIKTNPVK